jgi:hypothetical protein
MNSNTNYGVEQRNTPSIGLPIVARSTSPRFLPNSVSMNLSSKQRPFAIASANLEIIEKLLTGLEARRDKALACIANYRVSFAQQLRESSVRLIEGDDVPRLQDASVVDVTGE